MEHLLTAAKGLTMATGSVVSKGGFGVMAGACTQVQVSAAHAELAAQGSRYRHSAESCRHCELEAWLSGVRGGFI